MSDNTFEPLGSRTPTYSHIPDGDTERGEKAVRFARLIGLTLYPWQEDVLRDMCRTEKRKTHTGEKDFFAAPECVVIVPRQNGKNEVLIARELAGIFLFGERVILHTAQVTQTAHTALGRTRDIIQSNDRLMSWFADDYAGSIKFSQTNGKEEIIFPSGQIIHFRTRSEHTGRGMTVDLLVMDEALDLTAGHYNALSNTTAAVEDSQQIYASSAVNMDEHPYGQILSTKRWQGMDGTEGIYFAEWSAPEDADIQDVDTWKRANPSLVDFGAGVQMRTMQRNASAAKISESARNSFLVENLGVGVWYPRDSDASGGDLVFDESDIYQILTDETVNISRPVLAIDAHPERESIAISIAGKREDDGFHIHVGYLGNFDSVENVKTVIEAIDAIDPELIVVDKKNPASLLVPALDNAGYDVKTLAYNSVVESTSLFLQLAKEHRLSVTHDEATEKALRDLSLRKSSSTIVLERFKGVVTGITAGALAVYAANTLLEEPVIVKQTKKAQNKIARKGGSSWLNNNRQLTHQVR